MIGRPRLANPKHLAAHQGSCGESGFTVIELLVALALFSMLMTLLLGNVRFALKAWQQGSAHNEQSDHAVMVQSFLRRAIGDAYPLFIRDDPTRSHVDFDGAKRSLSFLASAPAVMEGGRFRFTLAIETRDGSADLLLNAKPELAAQNSSKLSIRNTLLRDVDSLEISYLGKAGQNQAGAWRETWVQQPELPQLVRVHVGFRPGDTRRWPDLIVAPRITADVDCAFDPLTRRCLGR